MTGRWQLARNVVVVAVLALAIGAYAWDRSRGPSVVVVRVRRADVVQTVLATGRVLPTARVELASVALGTVRAVDVDEGELVRAGQLLVELDDRDARAQLERALASEQSARARRSSLARLTSRVAATDVARADALLAQARATVERYERLRARDAVTGVELDDARTALAQLEAARQAAGVNLSEQSPAGSEGRVLSAALELARADVASAEARLAQLGIVAPVDGVVLSRAVDPGDVAQPGVTLITLAAAGAPSLRIEPDETTLAILREGQHAQASAEAFPAERFEATVAFIAPVVDAERGTVEVRLTVSAPPAYLRPDMTVSVEIEAGRHTDVLSLDADAVRDVGTAHPWVLRIAGDHAERQEVRLGLRGIDVVEILDGVGDGDRVVPVTERGIEAGMRVRPRDGDPP